MSESPTLENLAQVALTCLQEYLDRCARGEGTVIHASAEIDYADSLQMESWLAQGGMSAEDLAQWLPRYLAGTTHLHHPHYIGHQVAVTLPPTAVADLVNGVTNNGMAIYEMGPPAVALELAILRWMCAKVGLPQGSGGVLTHGGSLANLTALAAARAACAPESWREGTPRDLVLLAPATSHYSVERSAGLLGLGTDAVRPIAVDDYGRMIPEAVLAAGLAEEKAGRRVMAVVANACATATGLHDDLTAIGTLCREHSWWFHIDAAHGASAVLSPRYRKFLRGSELADSLIWDAHKMLGVSALCAAVLVREEGRLAAAFQQDAHYLGNPGLGHGVDLFARAVECTKVPLGLKLFLNLAVYGEQALADRLDAVYDSTRSFAALLEADPRTEILHQPESNILCFRFGGPDVAQRDLRQRLIEDGEFYLTATTFADRDWLRLTVMNPRTEESHIRALLDRLGELLTVK